MNGYRATLIAAGIVMGAYLFARYGGGGVKVQEAVRGIEEMARINVMELLAKFEGFRAEPYRDQAGLWTIGYGHLIVIGDGFWHPEHNPTGRKTITRDEALALKEKDSAAAIAAVNRCVIVPINDNQRAALISLAYNIGSGAFCGSSVVRKLNGGDVGGAADAFRLWNKVTIDGQKVVSAGLVTRREQEREIFLA